jgi:Tetratricopeptide repeat
MKLIRELLTQRWQLPTAVVAIGVFAWVLNGLRPAPRELRFDGLLADIHALVKANKLYEASNAAANLLNHQPRLLKEQQAVLHDLLAEVIEKIEVQRDPPDVENARLLIQHQERAEILGFPGGAEYRLREARAHEWLGQIQEALASYRAALNVENDAGQRRTALQSLVRLLEGIRSAESERREMIERLLLEEGVEPSFAWWALQRAIQEALDSEDLPRARALLEKFGGPFQRSDLRGYYEYLVARLDVVEGRLEDAAPRVQWVEAWLADHIVADIGMHKSGFLPAMNLTLKAEIELLDDRPQSALEHFDRAGELLRSGEMLVDAVVGKARALARLERHVNARATVRGALERLSREYSTRAALAKRSRLAMLELHRGRHEVADYPNSVAYLALALDLTDVRETDNRLELLELLGRENEAAALASADEGERSKFQSDAGDAFAAAAPLSRLDPPRYAALLWQAAQAFDGVGRDEDARKALTEFVATRSSDPRLAPAMLQIGMSLTSQAQFAEARVWLSRLIREFPLLEEASRARLALAENLLLEGPQHSREAETMLLELLEDGSVGPAAQPFHDGLLTLCLLLHQQERYAEAIARIEEFLEFYAGDPDARMLRFQLAEAYRRSALALRGKPAAAESGDAQEIEAAARLTRAITLYNEIAPSDAEVEDASADDRLLTRLALFHRAECLTSLGDGTAMDEAIATYAQLSARYPSSPVAMSAQVRMAEALLRQGRVVEARRAVERARWLLRGISDDAFAREGNGLDRDHWEKYLSTVADARLLRDVLEGTN